MRIITINQLPEDVDRQVVIKSSEKKYHLRMAAALERTLTRCHELHTEFESKQVNIRENAEKEGFQAGFALFFSELEILLKKYQCQQKERQTLFRNQFAAELEKSLQDPVIVDHIIQHLKAHCEHQKELRIILPKAVKLPDNIDTKNYIYTDHNHITVKNNTHIIRFPSDELCQSWLHIADEENHVFDVNQNKITADFLRNIAGKLIVMSQQLQTNLPIEEKNNDED